MVTKQSIIAQDWFQPPVSSKSIFMSIKIHCIKLNSLNSIMFPWRNEKFYNLAKMNISFFSDHVSEKAENNPSYLRNDQLQLWKSRVNGWRISSRGHLTFFSHRQRGWVVTKVRRVIAQILRLMFFLTIHQRSKTTFSDLRRRKMVPVQRMHCHPCFFS